MKLSRLLPPAVALLVVAACVALQRRSLAALESANAQLQHHIAAARSPGIFHDPSTAPATSAKDKAPLNWKTLATQLAAMGKSGGHGDIRVMLRLQQRVQAMTQQELVAALDDIAALDLPAASRTRLEQILIGPLIAKDPELALTRFLDRLQNDRDGISWRLADAMRQWALKDPAAAGAWFDQQIGAGKFDSKALNGRSQSRLLFEAAIIGILRSSDVQAAAKRLAALPENQRAEVLRNFNSGPLKDQDQAAYAQLVRDHLPASDQAQVLATPVPQMVSRDGYDAVTGYLNRIKATAAERATCAVQAATCKISSNTQQITRADIDAMRTWVDSQAPASTANLTGSILANATRGHHKLEFAAAAELAVQYNRASGNDDVLGTFLVSGAALSNKDQARLLAQQIRDAARRAEILKHLQ